MHTQTGVFGTDDFLFVVVSTCLGADDLLFTHQHEQEILRAKQAWAAARSAIVQVFGTGHKA